ACKTPTTIRSRPNKLYGTAKATPIGRHRGPAVKSVGKPDALIGHVRFDERGRETERLAKPQAAAPFLDSTVTIQICMCHRFPPFETPRRVERIARHRRGKGERAANVGEGRNSHCAHV